MTIFFFAENSKFVKFSLHFNDFFFRWEFLILLTKNRESMSNFTIKLIFSFSIFWRKIRESLITFKLVLSFWRFFFAKKFKNSDSTAKIILQKSWNILYNQFDDMFLFYNYRWRSCHVSCLQNSKFENFFINFNSTTFFLKFN